jgi:hypothetical protein
VEGRADDEDLAVDYDCAGDFYNDVVRQWREKGIAHTVKDYHMWYHIYNDFSGLKAHYSHAVDKLTGTKDIPEKAAN